MSILEALILALVEGLTEFLPVSSTAHLLFTEELAGIHQTEFVKMFTVAIQFGAILAVVVAYWPRFFKNIQWTFYRTLAIAVIPALILGKLFDDKIESLLSKHQGIAPSEQLQARICRRYTRTESTRIQ